MSIPSLPRGALVYSTDHVTKDDNQFSVEIVSLGEAADESGLCFCFRCSEAFSVMFSEIAMLGF